MKHALPNLGNLRVFESAARHLSFSEAAKELCITKGAVSYQIRKLESDIGTTLFKRSVRQVYLTESGQELYQSTRKVFAELSGTLERLQPGSSETVSIAVTTYVASRWLSPMVTGFCEKNPDLVLQFQHTVNSSAFDLNNVDIAIRWGRCDGKLDQARLMEIPMSLFPVCSPNLFNQLAQTAGPEKFSSVVLLSEDREQDLWLEWAGTRYHLNDNVQRVIPDANVRVQAAIDGQGDGAGR